MSFGRMYVVPEDESANRKRRRSTARGLRSRAEKSLLTLAVERARLTETARADRGEDVANPNRGSETEAEPCLEDLRTAIRNGGNGF